MCFWVLNWIDFGKKLSLHQSILSACCDDTLMNYFPNILTTFSDVFFSSELDWLYQKASLASVNSHTCHNEHSTQLFTLFIEYLFRCAFQFWYVLSSAKSYPCSCHFSLHVVTNTLREPYRTNIAVFSTSSKRGRGLSQCTALPPLNDVVEHHLQSFSFTSLDFRIYLT